ncbi:non-hydrolyzing UDP-N-acetylglucosamine 2-epimerase [Sphingomonas xanthus]|uniref:UDP-N-acetylglucosamine 2-epimerase (non-hydrolyzing) n=1 Tax=Sphingomonas xanthus TaxID=2594473 RepID=A0A516ISN4_9SPHN|nr:UDP-N-acetylglucosamine 2-epimerase (non-hydrolyzing) [Sphingomonas xanthus]QDP19907.1 UDP-N-acetylglucosamine 2-epimerase (non-hydrolyzing) [Sphingomonas xanthus]
MKRPAPKVGGKLRHYPVALVIGTRPEAIKLSPVVHALAARGEPPRLLLTGQQPGLELSDHGLQGFAVTPLHLPGQPDPVLHAELVRGALKRLLEPAPPQLLLVQGSTSSALGGALAGRDLGIALGHVEAGLRTHDRALPWPEEDNRQAIDRIADLLFAPTAANAANLQREEVPGEVHVTGNSGIDALAAIAGPLPLRPRRRWWRREFRLLVTCHRRENWEGGLARLAEALIRLAAEGVASDVLLPPNPTVTGRLTALIGGQSLIRLAAPISHAAMIAAIRSAQLVLSDSGGIQEEAPALGVPLLVLREKSERPEGVAAGNAILVGTDPDRIVEEVGRLRRDRSALKAMSRPTMPFGDGHAAPRIAAACLDYLARQRQQPARHLG